MSPRRGPTLLTAALLVASLAGCSEELGREATEQGEKVASPKPGKPGDRRSGSGEGAEPARCPPGLSGCRTASGRILYVEAVDPDGDGDAHFVLASAESISAPGVSIIDVARHLRPHPLPGAGDEISAAGPVLSGSFGQRQIQAVVVHVAGGD